MRPIAFDSVYECIRVLVLKPFKALSLPDEINTPKLQTEISQIDQAEQHQEAMLQYIKTLSPRKEFVIVILVAFGYSILGSLSTLFVPASGAHITESHLRFLLVYELAITTTLVVFLWIRGWNTAQLGLLPTVRDTGIGVGLTIAAYFAYAMVWLFYINVAPEIKSLSKALVQPNLHLPTVLAASTLNPIFEELFVCGYVISALKKTRTISFAVNVSVALRLTYHLYQGPISVISIVPLGLIFGQWFARTGRLWPVVIAHAIFDFVGLWPYIVVQ